MSTARSTSIRLFTAPEDFQQVSLPVDAWGSGLHPTDGTPPSSQVREVRLDYREATGAVQGARAGAEALGRRGSTACSWMPHMRFCPRVG